MAPETGTKRMGPVPQRMGSVPEKKFESFRTFGEYHIFLKNRILFHTLAQAWRKRVKIYLYVLDVSGHLGDILLLLEKEYFIYQLGLVLCSGDWSRRVLHIYISYCSLLMLQRPTFVSPTVIEDTKDLSNSAFCRPQELIAWFKPYNIPFPL